MVSRSNEQWLQALNEPSGEAQAEALQELRDFLLRAVLIYLARRRTELKGWSRENVRDLAEDLAQDALIDIRENLSGFRGDSRFTTWAYRFVINRAASELRRYRYRDSSLDRLREEQATIFRGLPEDWEPGSEVAPERLAEQRYYLNLLRQIIQTELSERQRVALVAILWEERSMDEVAAVLGITRNALYKLLHDARQRVKARLEARHLSEGDILAAFES